MAKKLTKEQKQKKLVRHALASIAWYKENQQQIIALVAEGRIKPPPPPPELP